MAALTLLQASPSSSAVFQLRSEANQLKAFKKHRDAQGMLSTASMPVQDLYALQQCLQLMSSELDAHSSGDSFVAVVDTGCSITCTNVETDFIPGTLQDLPSPIKLDGIAGGLVVTKQGQVCWEALDDFGNVVPFQTQAFYQEKLPCRLLSPQAFLKHSSQRIEDHFKIFHNRAELHQDGSKILTIPYNATFLPSITLFRRGKAEESLQAMYNSVVGENNANISPKAKHWLRWHFRLGHLAFEHVRRLGLSGYLDSIASSLWKSEVLQSPKCSACCYGKQARKPDNIHPRVQRPDTVGSLV